MPEALPLPLKEALTEKLAESLELPLPKATPRQLHGAIGLLRMPAMADTSSGDGGHHRSVATQAG